MFIIYSIYNRLFARAKDLELSFFCLIFRGRAFFPALTNVVHINILKL